MDYIDKIVIARVDHAISEMPRGRSRNRQSRERPYVQCSPEIRDNGYDRSRDRRPQDGLVTYGNNRDNGRDRSRDNNTQRQYSGNSEGRREQYRDRSPLAQGSLQRARSDSRNRACFKCQGLGHLIDACPSTHWYSRNGDIDVERDKLQNTQNPKGPRTPPSPWRRPIA